MNASEPLPHFVDNLLDYLRETHPTYATLDGVHTHDDLLGDLADAQVEASQALGAYIAYLENDVAPRARASFRLGREKFEQKLKLEEGLTVPVERLLAIATRELNATQEAFK